MFFFVECGAVGCPFILWNDGMILGFHFSIIVLWIVMYNKKLITIIKCLDWLQGLITGLIWVDSWIFIWSMNFLLMYFKIPYDFTILRSEFVLHFLCRIKIMILITLVVPMVLFSSILKILRIFHPLIVFFLLLLLLSTSSLALFPFFTLNLLNF